jgi:hypothetical protein
VLWGKVVPFDSNDAAVVRRGVLQRGAGVLRGRGSEAGGLRPPTPTPSPSAPASPIREELDMRVLAGDYPGSPFGADVVVASRATCRVLSARGAATSGAGRRADGAA